MSPRLSPRFHRSTDGTWVAAAEPHEPPLLAMTSMAIALVVAMIIGLTAASVIVARADDGASALPPAGTAAYVDPNPAMEAAAAVTAFLDGLRLEAEARAAAKSASESSARRAAAAYRAPNIDLGDGSVWDRLAHCETRNNWATNSVPGFSGGLGFANSTWISNGGEEFAPIAAEATREQQIVIAERVLAGSGWGAWPGCSDLLGLR